MKILTYGNEMRFLEDQIRHHAQAGEVVKILEAGCGREWIFPLDGVNYELTGVDLDADALEARRSAKRDLKHAIVGDLRTAELESSAYDIIYNAFVLEHVEGAEKVLENFVRWLKPGGLLILRIPDPNSVQGFLARTTPHWFHVFYYKWAWKLKDAGKPGFAPYPVVYDAIVSLSGLRTFFKKHGFLVLAEVGVGNYERGHGLARKITPLAARFISGITLGQVHSKYANLTIVAKKPEGPSPGAIA